MFKFIDNKGKIGLVVILIRLEVFWFFFVEMIIDNLKYCYVLDYIKLDLVVIDYFRKYLYFVCIKLIYLLNYFDFIQMFSYIYYVICCIRLVFLKFYQVFYSRLDI